MSNPSRRQAQRRFRALERKSPRRKPPRRKQHRPRNHRNRAECQNSVEGENSADNRWQRPLRRSVRPSPSPVPPQVAPPAPAATTTGATGETRARTASTRCHALDHRHHNLNRRQRQSRVVKSEASPRANRKTRKKTATSRSAKKKTESKRVASSRVARRGRCTRIGLLLFRRVHVVSFAAEVKLGRSKASDENVDDISTPGKDVLVTSSARLAGSSYSTCKRRMRISMMSSPLGDFRRDWLSTRTISGLGSI